MVVSQEMALAPVDEETEEAAGAEGLGVRSAGFNV